jgi:hypothetical protein
MKVGSAWPTWNDSVASRSRVWPKRSTIARDSVTW